MSRQESEIQSLQPQQMLFHRSYKTVDHIRNRKPNRYYPVNNTEYAVSDSSKLIVINLEHDQLDDTTTTCLSFECEMGHASDVNMHSILDIFEEVAVYVNDQKLESYRNASLWANALTYLTANASWAKHEGTAFLGWGGKVLDDRHYVVPLSLFFGFCRVSTFVPILGAKVRFEFRLRRAIEALNKRADTANAAQNKYTLSNVTLLSDMIEVSDSYRQSLIQALQGPMGVKLPYTTLSTTSKSCSPGDTQTHTIEFNQSNLLSLYFIHRPKLDDDIATAKNHLRPQSHGRLAFDRLDVRVGAIDHTPPGGVKGHAELYRSTELASTSLADFSGTGLLDYDAYSGAVAAGNANPSFCVGGINMEKLIMDDHETAMNSGVSASAPGASTQIRVNLQTTSPLVSTSNIEYALAHRNVLVMKQGGIRVVD